MAENEEDQPIYVYVFRVPEESLYVIEQIKKDDDDDDDDDGSSESIPPIVESKRDRIKALPSLSPIRSRRRPYKLEAVDSKLYLINEFQCNVMDLAVKNLTWLSKQKPHFIDVMAAEEEGCLYALKHDETIHLIRLADDDTPPSSEFVFDYPSENLCGHIKLVGIYQNRIYMIIPPTKCCYYDLKTESFTEVGNDFTRDQSCIPYKKFLLTYGRGYKKDEDMGFIKVQGIYVYDTESRIFLPTPVQGLHNDDVILPRVNEDGGEEGYLVQIGTHQGSPKLALVWYSFTTDIKLCDTTGSRLHFSKFVLHLEERPDDHPNFVAEILSNGMYQLGDKDRGVMDCSAGVRMSKRRSNICLGNAENASVAWMGSRIKRRHQTKKRKIHNKKCHDCT